MKKTYEKIYVKVNSDFDSTGFMTPRALTWSDGRTFRIEAIKDFRPASAVSRGHTGDCYRVIIHGEERYLFFEKSSDMFTSRVGRWFVERPIAG